VGDERYWALTPKVGASAAEAAREAEAAEGAGLSDSRHI